MVFPRIVALSTSDIYCIMSLEGLQSQASLARFHILRFFKHLSISA